MNKFARERTLFILAIAACGAVFGCLYWRAATADSAPVANPVMWGMNARDLVEFAALSFSAAAIIRAAWLVWARRGNLRDVAPVNVAVIALLYFTRSMSAPVLGAKLFLMLTFLSVMGGLAVLRERRGE